MEIRPGFPGLVCHLHQGCGGVVGFELSGGHLCNLCNSQEAERHLPGEKAFSSAFWGGAREGGREGGRAGRRDGGGEQEPSTK
jgi:hypothetical protein